MADNKLQAKRIRKIEAFLAEKKHANHSPYSSIKGVREVCEILRQKQVPWKSFPSNMRADRDFALLAFQCKLVDWKTILKEYEMDQEFALVALRSGDIHNLRDSACLTAEIVRELLRTRKIGYMGLPDWLRSDPEFCLSIITGFPFPDWHYVDLSGLCDSIFRCCPALIHERKAWAAVIHAGSFPYLAFRKIGNLCVPNFVLKDAELMLELCRHNITYLTEVDPTLGTDFEFVSKVIEENVVGAPLISEDFVDMFPTYVISKFEKLCHTVATRDENDYPIGYTGSGLLRRLSDTLGERLAVRSVLSTTWFEAGLPIMNSFAFQPWLDDAEKLLLIAERCPRWDWMRDSFRLCNLRDDPTFMLQAMQIEPRLFECATQRLRTRNFQLQLLVLSTSKPALYNAVSNNMGASKMENIRVRVQNELAPYDSFLVALGWWHHKIKGDSFPLELREFVAGYAGIPRGTYRKHLLVVRKRLTPARNATKLRKRCCGR